jgi:sulfur carrier protein
MQDTEFAALPENPPIADRTAPPLSLTVNGEPQQAAAATLLELLADLGYGGNKVATAVNGDFVPERLRAGHRLISGDAVEIVAPRQGG